MSQRIGLVLAGGDGSRLGREKGELEIDGRPLADRAAEVLWALCSGVLISVRPGGTNPAPDYPCLEDDPPAGRGPLAGIHAAFEQTGQADLLVLACDYPLVDQALMRALIDRALPEDDLVLLSDGSGRDHPLVGLWRRRTATPVKQAVEQGYLKVRGLLPELRVHRLGPADFPDRDLNHVMLNLNWPSDLFKL